MIAKLTTKKPNPTGKNHRKKFKKVCLKCKSPFMAIRDNVKYCGSKCKFEFRYTRPPESIECAYCKKSFKPRNNTHKYCTKRCGNRAADQGKKRIREGVNDSVDRVKVTDSDKYFYSLVNPHQTRKLRPCLRCRKPFNTTSNNRICASCTGATTAYRSIT